MADIWDAGQYLRFGGERSRPFFDLIAQIGATDPGYVADLGCGPGNLTAVLAQRWPGATVVGVDNSPEMIAAATEQAAPGRREPHVRARRRLGLAARPSGRRARLQRRAAVGAGSPAAAAATGPICSPRAAGSPSSSRATSTSPATRSSASSRSRRAGGRCWRKRNSTGRRANRPSTWNCWPGPAMRWTPGRPATCTSCRARTRWSSGPRARRSGRCSRPSTEEQAKAFSAEYAERLRQVYKPQLVRHHLPLPARVHRGSRPAGLIRIR